MMLFVDGTHLSGPYSGTLLAACALDADNHLFDFAYAIVSGETNEEWLWFLKMVSNCLCGLKPVIMSDRNPGILAGDNGRMGLVSVLRRGWKKCSCPLNLFLKSNDIVF